MRIRARAAAMVSTLAALTFGPAAKAQDPPPPAAADSQSDLIRVFLDCQNARCDFEFVRTEIAFVNFVRDRSLADVHIIVTSQQTGSGSEYTLEFLGQARRAGLRDTATFATQLGDNQDEIRRTLVRSLAQGLVRYVRGTPVARALSIGYRPTGASVGASRGAKDRWNYWVYRIRSNANLSGSSNDENRSFSGSLSASRVTDNWKLIFRTSADYEETTFDLTEGGQITRIQRSFDGSADIVKSLTAHWSTGVRLSADKNLYRNLDLGTSLMPGIEYNIFPYSESTRRQLVTRYSLGLRQFNYVDTTIFGEVSETRPHHSLIVSVDAVQPWGRVGFSLNGDEYLHDRARRQFGIFGDASWRIVRGLDFNIGGGYSYIRDQLSIRRGSLTNEEIIIRLREQSTDYFYFMHAGLSFTFGSAFNNVVNTRFGGGERFFFF